jgi:hypothetical protein
MIKNFMVNCKGSHGVRLRRARDRPKGFG